MATDVMDRPETDGAKADKAKKASKAGHIEVQAGKLAKAMQQIDKVVERKNTLPILYMVRIDAKRDAITLTATDLDIWVSDRIEHDCHASEIQPFSLCVSSRKLFEAVNALPVEATVSLTTDGGRLRVEAHSLFGPVSYRFPTLPVADFPSGPTIQAVSEFEISAFALASGFDAVRHAISTEETRYYLNGIFWHVKDLSLVMAATDGHRLARHSMALPDGAETLPDSIIARKSVSLIGSIIDQLPTKQMDELDISVAVATNRISLTIGSFDVTAKLIDGTFPDYTRVIPTANDRLAVVKPAFLAGAVRQVMLIASEKTRAVKCVFESGKVSLSCVSPDNGEASAQLPCDYTGEDMTIGFNSTYLLAILDRMAGEECRLKLADPAAPTLFVNYEGASTDYVLMPMLV